MRKQVKAWALLSVKPPRGLRRLGRAIIGIELTREHAVEISYPGERIVPVLVTFDVTATTKALDAAREDIKRLFLRYAGCESGGVAMGDRDDALNSILDAFARASREGVPVARPFHDIWQHDETGRFLELPMQAASPGPHWAKIKPADPARREECEARCPTCRCTQRHGSAFDCDKCPDPFHAPREGGGL